MTPEQQQLVLKNRNLVRSIVNKYPHHPYEYDDMLQEGTLGLILAAKKFEPDRKLAFSTYATYWIRAKVLMWLERNAKHRPEPPRPIRGVDNCTPEVILQEKQERARVYQAVLKLWPQLTDRDVYLLTERILSVDPASLRQVASELGLSHERVRQIQVKLVTLLKQELHHEEI